MHPHRYDGSPGAYATLLERLSTMGHEQEATPDQSAMPAWRDPIPFLGQGQLDNHMFDIRKMADRDAPTLHESDELNKSMGHHVIIGACSTMNGLPSRQRALEVVAERAAWLSTYLTPERLDTAIAWRDQMARRSHVARQMSEQGGRANIAESSIENAIIRAYDEPAVARRKWSELRRELGEDALEAAAQQVEENPEILGELKGGRRYLGFGSENEERLNARTQLTGLVNMAREATHHRGQANRLRRQYDTMDKPPRAEGELAETLAAMRDIGRTNLHYMANMLDMVTQSRALITNQRENPVESILAARSHYQEWKDSDDPGTRITARQLLEGMSSAVVAIRRNPDLAAILKAEGLQPGDPIAGDAVEPTTPGPETLPRNQALGGPTSQADAAPAP